MHATAALLARQVIVVGLNGLTGLVLARWLTPAEFGVFGIVTFALALLTVLGDVGLGAGLVRQGEEPSEEDYRVVLGLQHALAVALAAALWLAAARLSGMYRLSASGIAMFHVVALTVLLTPIQSVSTIRLERHLLFGKLSAVEVVQAIVYNLSLLALIARGAGIVSFSAALLARAVAGALFTWLLAPWRIAWRFDPARVRELLAFGLPYQGSSVVSLAKDSLSPVLVGALLGTAAVGQIHWAQMVAVYPVLALMALSRIYLPSFARLQAHPDHLARFVENVMRMTNALVAPIAVTMLALAEPLVRLVFGSKWLNALPLFHLLWVANLIVPCATPLLGLLNALGLSRVTFGFTLLWMVMTWALGTPLVLMLGTLGYGIANLLVQFSGLWLVRVARARVKFRVLAVVTPPWGVAFTVGALLYAEQRIHPPGDVPTLIGLALGGLLLYTLGLALVWRGRMRNLISALAMREAMES